MEPDDHLTLDDEAIERRVLADLDRLGADYQAVRIDPSFANTAAFCERYGYAMEQSANCIVTVSKKGPPVYAANLVQATRRLDVNRVVRQRMGVRKASFAAPDETVEVTGMLPDGVTPFGLPDGMPLFVDAPVLDIPRVIVGGGSRSLKIELDPEVFVRMPAVTVVEDLSRAAG